MKKRNRKQKNLRILHVADPHIGFSGNASRYNEYSPLRVSKTVDGINAREWDVYQAWIWVIDQAIALDVDVVVNAGDGLDAWGYKPPRIVNFYNEQILRLRDHGIYYIEIVGNHNLSNLGGKGCHLDFLGKVLKDDGHVSFHGVYEQVEVPGLDVVFHCVPSTFNQGLLDEAINEAQNAYVNGKVNIGIGHFGVTTIKHYAENAINSLVVDLDRLIACKFEYFALGDYHKPTDFGYGIRYAGSIERLGFDEMSNDPQVLLVEFDDSGDSITHTVTPHFIPVRAMFDLPTVDAEGLGLDEINDRIKRSIMSKKVDDAIVRLRVKNLATHVKRSLHVDEFRELTDDSLYFKLELVDKVNKTKQASTSGTIFPGVIEGFKAFAMALEEDKSFSRDELISEGIQALMEVRDNATTTN